MSESLSHADERLGHVAMDMGLMTQAQVDECRREIVDIVNDGGSATFSSVAVGKGFLATAELAQLEEEELRRRRLINGYEIIDLIGTGTIAAVYRAIQVAMEREVALKILHPRLATDPVFVKAYIAEAQAVSRFHHPHIVQGIDVGESNGFYYFAHEYLSGGSLGSRVKAEGPLNEKRALLYLRQTTSALRHAWEVAVFHGDLNPGNLLLDAQGDIKLANLGVPRVAKPKEGTVVGKRPGFVRCGPEYAAPEQLAQPELVNTLTDMYSLGASFYHMSFGVPPFLGESMEEIFRYRETHPVPSFELEAQVAFSPKFVKLIRDMMEPDSEKRPTDPEELSRRLEGFQIAGGDEWSGLARQVRQVSSPGRVESSRRVIVGIPAPATEDVQSNLTVRRRNVRTHPDAKIIWIAVAAALLALLLFLALR